MKASEDDRESSHDAVSVYKSEDSLITREIKLQSPKHFDPRNATVKGIVGALQQVVHHANPRFVYAFPLS
jgi:hypothetical protein